MRGPQPRGAIIGTEVRGSTVQDTDAKILIVDDEQEICDLLTNTLETEGAECITAANSHEALGILHNTHIAVLICDVTMPEITGMDLMAMIKQTRPRCKVILMTAHDNTQFLVDALSSGAYDFFYKPFELEQLVDSVRRALNDNTDQQHLPVRAARAIQMERELRRASLQSIRALAKAVEAKDPYTRRHSDQVTHYATNLARHMSLSVSMVESIRVAALLHDIGKIGVPDHILTKPGTLTDEEFALVRKHPVLGAEILSNISMFATETLLVRSHHERWDGEGYPDGLTAEEIPLGGRIIGIADALDAMLMKRVYKDAFPVERVLGELEQCSGAQFDPRVAAAALDWCHTFPEKLILPASERTVELAV